MKDAATLAVPNFEAALRGEVTTKEFYKQVGKYRLRLLCRPLAFILELRLDLIDKLNEAEGHTVDEVRVVISKVEEVWEEWPDKGLDDTVRL